MSRGSWDRLRSDAVADAMMMPDRADPVMVAVTKGRGAGGGRTQHGQSQNGNDEGFHCDLHNR